MTMNKLIRLALDRFVLAMIAIAAMTVASCAPSHASEPIQQTIHRAAVAPIKVDNAWLDSVHLELFQCTRAFADGSSQEFYLVGEMHAYNAATSKFADSLLTKLGPGLFMSEGADSSQPRSKLMKDYASTMHGLFDRIGYNEPELSRLAKARGIRVLWLEQIDTATGVYAGVTEPEKQGLEMLVGGVGQSGMAQNTMFLRMMKQMLDNPEASHKAIMAMLSKFGVDTLKLTDMKEPKSGIIDTRNQLMSSQAIQYILPEYGCIVIRFGMGHAEGMIEQLKQANCDCENQSLQAFLEEAR